MSGYGRVQSGDWAARARQVVAGHGPHVGHPRAECDGLHPDVPQDHLQDPRHQHNLPLLSGL